MVSVKKTSGNIFADMGFAAPGDELLKANLTAKIAFILQEKKLKQKDAAKLLGIDQPKISALINGRYTGFSVERLFTCLLSLEKDIDIIIKPHSGERNPEINVFSAT